MANNNKPIITTPKSDKLKPKTHSQDFIPSFIRKTYDILEEAKFPQLIDWNTEGNAIVIKKPSEFSQKVLPVYFKHNNLTSFVRQLNMYNFHKRRSQNLEHIYSHELFQKGKRQLLKEIKRKTHDHNPEKAQKSPESQETPKSEDVSTLMNENQFLKRLYNEAMTRVAMLENQAKELVNQNQSLWAQICNNRPISDREKAFKPLMAAFEAPKELTQEQMSMTMGKVTLNISSGNKGPVPMQMPATKLFPVVATAPLQQQPQQTAVNVMPFTKFFSSGQQRPQNTTVPTTTVPTTTEESSGSTTEVSPTSPVMQQVRMETEGVALNPLNPLMIMNQQHLQIPKLRMEPHMQALHIPHIAHQAARISSEALGIGISRQEMSVGQIFDAWNSEFQQGEEVLCFADQKGDNKMMMMNTNVPTAVTAGNIQSVFQDKSLLGKRKFDNETNIHVPEPTMKRHELSIFSRKGMISTGIEDKEIHEGAGGSADDIDLMNFNQPFCGWPKAS